MDVVINGNQEQIPKGSTPLPCLYDYQQHILNCLAYHPKHPPLADFLRHYYHKEGQWLIASPIHWEATHNDAFIRTDVKELVLSEEESLLLFESVSEFLAIEHLKPIYHNRGIWLLPVSHKPPIHSQALPTLFHQSLMPILADLDDSFYWQRLLTELQMMLSNHPMNEKRSLALSVNGLWFWGEGTFVLQKKRPIATDDEILLTLASEQKMPIEYLTPQTRFHKNQLLILKDPATLEHSNLAKQLKKKKTNWYWNNQAYQQPAQHWWAWA